MCIARKHGTMLATSVANTISAVADCRQPQTLEHDQPQHVGAQRNAHHFMRLLPLRFSGSPLADT
jgi:hypothetical protein